MTDKRNQPTGGRLIVHIVPTSPLAISTVIEQAQEAGQKLEKKDMASVFRSLLEKVNVLVTLGNSVSKVWVLLPDTFFLLIALIFHQIHPYVNLAWQVLSVGLQVNLSCVFQKFLFDCNLNS